ncbi:hypothetical protein [Wenzhouxiangella marina]|uniref:Uncharacterized protein n=1 Tax=Wenzhouxiangella marina TaxID=1579979 RepID=A0A0K0XUU3_9GAMM|nr:hypothetical protein [Wenzhouxiangella marina]AKS41453.1 hypothetical protein WM2015_1077 [Wenzhouxiangella marina]MBB6086792.1 hypothetical protein [Wenzhouxiangella marina]
MTTHVFIGTTCGPVAIQRITPEASGVQSVVCLNGTVQALPISHAYHDFVRRGTGIIARDFEHDAFRVDLAERVDQGVSWQLPIYVAHAVHARGQLGNGQPEAGDTVIWATGEVGADGDVRPVERTADKLNQSLGQIQQWRQAGIQVRVLLPDTNLAEGVEQVSDLAGVAGVHTLSEALESFGGGVSRPSKDKTSSAMGSAKPSAWLIAAVIVALLASVIWWLSSGKGGQELIELDDFGGQVVRPTRPQPQASRASSDAGRVIASTTATDQELWWLYGTGDCAPANQTRVAVDEVAAMQDEHGALCGLAMAAGSDDTVLVVSLTEGARLPVGPSRAGYRSTRLHSAAEGGRLAVIWLDSSAALRVESLLERWLRQQPRPLAPATLEAWLAEQGDGSQLRWIEIAP